MSESTVDILRNCMVLLGVVWFLLTGAAAIIIIWDWWNE